MAMEIPEIRAKILSHLLVSSKNGKPKTSVKDLCNVRLVNTDWYDSATIALRKLKTPMFQLSLGDENSTKCVESEVDKFVSRMNMRDPSAEQIPTYSLKLYPNFFQQKYYKCLKKLFKLYGCGLLSLEVHFPEDGNMRCNFPDFSLPNLSEFYVTCYKKWSILENKLFKDIKNASSQVAPFVLDIFQAASNLQRFEIGYWEKRVNLPEEIMTLTPPLSVKSLKYTCTSHVENLSESVWFKHVRAKVKLLRFPF